MQTIKGPAEDAAGAGLHARPEHRVALAARRAGHGAPVGDAVAQVARARVRAAAGSRAASRPISSGGRFRSRFPDGTLALLCVDHGEIRATRDGRKRRVPIAEIEIELESGAAANLFGLALRLADDLPVAIMTASKAERGIALLRGERD